MIVRCMARRVNYTAKTIGRPGRSQRPDHSAMNVSARGGRYAINSQRVSAAVQVGVRLMRNVHHTLIVSGKKLGTRVRRWTGWASTNGFVRIACGWLTL